MVIHIKRKESRILVPPSGPLDAKIVGIGEAPAVHEVRLKQPFVGSAGQYLRTYVRAAGLDIDSIRLTNVSKERAPGDKIAQMPRDRLEYWKGMLIQELNDMPNIHLIIAFGNYAMEAVAGRMGITHLRGSVLKPIREIQHDCIVVPTRHPSVVHYNYEVWPLIVADLTRVRKIQDAGFKFEFPTFNFTIRPTLDQVLERLAWMRENPDQMYTLDVETPHGNLSCIGIGWSRSDAICIPFFMGNGDSYWTKSEEKIIWKELAHTLPLLNINNQNWMFDWEVLLGYGIELKIPEWDPMLMHHCLWSPLSHTLDTITSLYTDMTFYKKDERDEKGLKGSAITAGGEANHWEYNAKDTVAAWWSIEELIKELNEDNMMEVYKRFYVNIYESIFHMNLRGARVDVPKLKDHQDKIRKENAGIEETLNKAAGRPFNSESPKQVKELLTKDMNLKGYVDRSSGKVSMNEKNLIKMAYKYQTEIPLLIVKHRKNKKALGLFSEENVINGRLRTRYALNRTDTGRLSSRKTFGGSGMNLQNVKRGDTRRFFVPEPGEVFIGVDMKQAEARVVAWLAEDPRMIEVVESGQIHLRNYETIFNEKADKNNPLYIIAKSLVHGGNYDIGAHEFARLANVSYQEAVGYLEMYHKTYPGIRARFHKFVQDEIKSKRMLYNPFGRRFPLFGRMDRQTFKQGYAFIPQSTVTDVNKIALKRISKYTWPLMDTHDGMLLSVHPNDVKNAVNWLKEAYDTVFLIWDKPHTIPVEITVGDNWYEMEEIEV